MWSQGLGGVLLALCAFGCPDSPPGASGSSPADLRLTPDAPLPITYSPCLRQPSTSPLRYALPIGGVQYQLRGGFLRPVNQNAPQKITLGILGDTREALPLTLQRLTRVSRFFQAHGAQAIVVLGGLDATYEGTRALLQQLQGLPVLALPGDRVSRSGFQAAVENLGSRYVDLSRIRAVLMPGVSLISVPGYALPHELLAKEQGCSYNEEDIRALAQSAAALPAPRLLLSYGPPRGRGPLAVDRAFGGVNIGDPLLSRLISEADIAWGAFSHVHEAAGHATTLKGQPVAPGQWSRSLLLNVGAADSLAHEDLRGNGSNGNAALLEIQGTRARYTLVDLTKLAADG